MTAAAPHGKFRVLHITPHLGGGVGRVLGALFQGIGGDGEHTVASLDVANQWATKQIRSAGVAVKSSVYNDIPGLINQIKKADVVVVHWWNHPLLYALLVRWSLPPARIILWSHVSGLHAPAEFTPALVEYPDRFIATTPISRDASAVANPTQISVLWATSGLSYAANVKYREHKGFIVGYLGTVDFSKLHPLFIDMCKKINITDSFFEVCGGDAHEEIAQQAAGQGLIDKIQCFGKVADIGLYLERWDVFGYPLNPLHFGTCDQALAEAMAAAIPPVVLNNPMECSMVQHMNTGLVSKSNQEYVENISLLYDDPELRRDLGAQAKEYALCTFSLETMVKQWRTELAFAMEFSRKERQWSGRRAGHRCSGFDIFLESNLKNRQLFERFRTDDANAKMQVGALVHQNPAWRSKNKGTAHQYYSFFGDDADLKRLSACMR